MGTPPTPWFCLGSTDLQHTNRAQLRPAGSREEPSWGQRPEPSGLTGHQKEDGAGQAAWPWPPGHRQ